MLFACLIVVGQLSAQSFEKYSMFFDYNKKLTDDKLQAHYLYLYEPMDGICRRTEYYMKEQSVKAICFFTDTSCKEKTGQYISYYPSKKIESKGAYVKNKKEGLWLSYHENGNKKDSAFYKNNNSVGTSYTWFENGSVSIKREMDAEGKGNGTETSYWENGKPDFEGVWENGKRSKLWTYHHLNGNKSAEVVYENNKIITSKCFDENGVEEKICDSSKIKKAPPTLKDGTPLYKHIQKALVRDNEWQLRGNGIPYAGGIFFVWVGFDIGIDGKLSKIKLEHGATKSLDKASLKIFEELKEMRPLSEFNRKFEQHVTQRIEFRFSENSY